MIEKTMKYVMIVIGGLLFVAITWLSIATVTKGPTLAAYLAGVLSILAIFRFGFACYRIFHQESKNNERRND